MPALELDPIEARILGVMIEKEFTTPEQYPLTLNALVAGCNQKSNRDPVLELREGEVRDGVERLRRKSLTGASHSAGGRAERYRHAAAAIWELSRPQLAVLAELLLRGAQMPGELRSRASRISPFESLGALEATLEELRTRGFVQRLDPLPGSRAPQWAQIVAAGSMPTAPGVSALTGFAKAHSRSGPEAEAVEPPPGPTPRGEPRVDADAPGLEARVTYLEAEVARLARLYRELSGPG